MFFDLSREDENRVEPVRRRLKLTDYFVQRRSNRKTQETINAEKHQILVKAILDGTQDGLTVVGVTN